jgi:two-component system response regulator HydG
MSVLTMNVRPEAKSLMVGESAAIEKVRRDIDVLTSFPRVPTVITGETGTGKEVAAHEISRLSGAVGNFVTVDLAGLSESIAERELFGHEKGAFTDAGRGSPGLLATAHEGTILLDEIGEMSDRLQQRLLRFMDEGTIRPLGSVNSIKVRARVIAVTRRNLRNLVKEGKFREDLFYRLGTNTIEMPPLREREGDIPILAARWRERFCEDHGKPRLIFAPEAMVSLEKHKWPGNIRELFHVLTAAAMRVCHEGRERIELSDLPKFGNDPESDTLEPRFDPASRGDVTLEVLTREYILYLLGKYGGNRTAVASILGIARQHLYGRMKRLQIPTRREV